MTIGQVQHLLSYLGFAPGLCDGKDGPKTQAAVTAFQRRVGLTQDGQAGPETQAAMISAVANGLPEVPDSDTFWTEIEYFSREEFRCPCGKCGGFPVEPDEHLVREVNGLRDALGVQVIIVPPDGHSGGSGIRCAAYNATFSNSAKNSRHLIGKAADFSAPGASASEIEGELSRRRSAGSIRYWYRISPGAYHMDVD